MPGGDKKKGIDFYSEFCSDENLLKEFNVHVRKRNFELEVMDILLKVLANTLKRSMLVADVRPVGVVETKSLPPFQSGQRERERHWISHRRIEARDHFEALEYTLVKNGIHFIILLYPCKLALFISSACAKYKRILKRK